MHLGFMNSKKVEEQTRVKTVARPGVVATAQVDVISGELLPNSIPVRPHDAPVVNKCPKSAEVNSDGPRPHCGRWSLRTRVVR